MAAAAAAGAEEGSTPEAELIADQLRELEEAWARLRNEMAERRERLSGADSAQHYYNDADEAEAWIGEQELYMIAEDKAKVSGEVELIVSFMAPNALLIIESLLPSH